MASVLMASEGALGAHTGLTNNPHAVTKAQVGLGNVDNTADTNKPVSTAMRAALVLKQDKLSDAQMAKVNNALTNANAFDAAGAASAALAAHLAETNPHVITKEALGLGNVNNTSDVNKPISTATQTALNAKQDKLTAGDNITIAADGTISATGGGGTPEDYETVRTNAATGATHAESEGNPHNTTADDVGALSVSDEGTGVKVVDDEVQFNGRVDTYGDLYIGGLSFREDGKSMVMVYSGSQPVCLSGCFIAERAGTEAREDSIAQLGDIPSDAYIASEITGDETVTTLAGVKSALFASDGFFYPSAPAGSLAGKINTIESQLSGLADALAAL